MTDDEMTPVLDVHQNGAPVAPAASLDAIATLIHSFGSMIANMERRLMDRMAENALASKERWETWEARFNVLETKVDDHLREVREDDIRTEARVKPVVMSLAYLGRHWRTIALLLFVALGLLGFGVETLRTVLG